MEIAAGARVSVDLTLPGRGLTLSERQPPRLLGQDADVDLRHRRPAARRGLHRRHGQRAAAGAADRGRQPRVEPASVRGGRNAPPARAAGAGRARWRKARRSRRRSTPTLQRPRRSTRTGADSCSARSRSSSTRSRRGWKRPMRSSWSTPRPPFSRRPGRRPASGRRAGRSRSAASVSSDHYDGVAQMSGQAFRVVTVPLCHQRRANRRAAPGDEPGPGLRGIARGAVANEHRHPERRPPPGEHPAAPTGARVRSRGRRVPAPWTGRSSSMARPTRTAVSCRWAAASFYALGSVDQSSSQATRDAMRSLIFIAVGATAPRAARQRLARPPADRAHRSAVGIARRPWPPPATSRAGCRGPGRAASSTR